MCRSTTRLRRSITSRTQVAAPNRLSVDLMRRQKPLVVQRITCWSCATTSRCRGQTTNASAEATMSTSTEIPTRWTSRRGVIRCGSGRRASIRWRRTGAQREGNGNATAKSRNVHLPIGCRTKVELMWGKRRDMTLRGRMPFNAEPPCSVLADAEITALDAFYSRNHGPLPDIAHEQWRLTVDGLIDKPLTLTYDQLVTGFTPVSVV